jgi:TIR domain
MPSVFLSYDHEDSDRAATIARALEGHGHAVWWDRHIHGGAEYNSEIEGAVDRSDAVVVLWSKSSVRSAWVRDEAAEGRDRGKLIPVLIDRIKPPMGFRQYQTIDAAGWSGGRRIPRLNELLHSVDSVAQANSTSTKTAAIPDQLPKTGTMPSATGDGISRRVLVGGGAAAAAAALTGGGFWWFAHERVDPAFQALMNEGEEAVRNGTVDERTLHIFEQSVAMRPESAKAWGLLALVASMQMQSAEPKQTAQLLQQAKTAARRAISIDSREPNALLAMFDLEGSTLDWATRDRRLREIIGIDAKNVGAIAQLVVLLQATGLTKESWSLNERALVLEPLSADFLSKRALKLWIGGRTSQADKVIDQVRALYPTSWWPWWVRFLILAFSARPRAAAAMLDGNLTMDGQLAEAALWRVSLTALEQRSRRTISKAKDACIIAARTSAGLAGESVMILSALGEVDMAFDIADGFLLSRGSIVRRDQPQSTEVVNNAAWRINTQWMFTPPAAVMRADPRFLQLCDGVGLTDYWQKRGVTPDYRQT